MDRTSVLVINLAGGVPSPLVERALAQLPSFRRLGQNATTYRRAYTTNACPVAALHDLIADTPLGALADDATHGWSCVRHTPRTLFDVFRQHDYVTEFRGTLGLSDSTNPHSATYQHVATTAKYMQGIGVDKFDPHDAAFLPYQLARSHDERACAAVARSIRDCESAHLVVLSLLGCHDLLRCGLKPPGGINIGENGISSSLPSWKSAYPKTSHTSQLFSRSVLEDDACHEGTRASSVPALRAQALLDEAFRCDMPRDSLQFVRQCHDFAWSTLVELDASIESVLEAVETRYGSLDAVHIFVTATAALSLREHGAMARAPWDGCCRSFLVARLAGQHGTREDWSSINLGVLPTMMLSAAGIAPEWHPRPTLGSLPVTISTAVSAVAQSALVEASPSKHPCFFVRTLVQLPNCTEFSVIVWFSVAKLARAAGMASVLYAIQSDRDEWPNPIIGSELDEIREDPLMHLQVYRLSSDPDELVDLSQDDYWMQSEMARHTKRLVDDELRKLHAILLIRFPRNLLELTPHQCMPYCMQSSLEAVPHMLPRNILQICYDADVRAVMKYMDVDLHEYPVLTVFVSESGNDQMPSPVAVVGIEYVTGNLLAVDGSELRVRTDALGLRVNDFVVACTQVKRIGTKLLSKVRLRPAPPVQRHTLPGQKQPQHRAVRRNRRRG